MGKVTVDRIVSLIIEQINADATNNFAPNEFTFIDSIEKYGDIFFKDNEQPKDNIEGSMEAGLESDAASDLDEMARAPKYDVQKLPQPLRIPVNLLITGSKTTAIPRIVCIDPETNQEVEGVVISDEYYMMPNGDRVLRFYNYGEEQKVDRSSRRLRFVVLPEIENKYFSDLPRNVVSGTGYKGPVNYEIAPPNETPEDREIRLKKIVAQKEGKAKRYGLFPIINDMFSSPQVLDRLDICLIPETWATTQRTEHSTNVILRKKFGGTGSQIDADFYAVRDVLNLNQAIDDIMNLRADIAEGRIENEGEETFDLKREREKSSRIPRKHANYKYMNGNWEASQRVYDPNFFKKAGGKTRIYELNSKNIQEGLKELDVESKLHIGGIVSEDQTSYILRATFSATLNARNLTSGEGENRGPLVEPFTVSLVKPIPEDENVDINNFNIVTQPEFFVNEGMIVNGKRTGFLPALLSRLGEAILEKTDPDDVQQRMVLLAQEAVEENTQP